MSTVAATNDTRANMLDRLHAARHTGAVRKTYWFDEPIIERTHTTPLPYSMDKAHTKYDVADIGAPLSDSMQAHTPWSHGWFRCLLNQRAFPEAPPDPGWKEARAKLIKQVKAKQVRRCRDYECPMCLRRYTMSTPLTYCSACDYSVTEGDADSYPVEIPASPFRPLNQNVIWTTYLRDWTRVLVVAEHVVTKKVQVQTGIFESEQRLVKGKSTFYVAMAEQIVLPVTTRAELDYINRTYFAWGEPLLSYRRDKRCAELNMPGRHVRHCTCLTWRVTEPVEGLHTREWMDDATYCADYWAMEMNDDWQGSDAPEEVNPPGRSWTKDAQ